MIRSMTVFILAGFVVLALGCGGGDGGADDPDGAPGDGAPSPDGTSPLALDSFPASSPWYQDISGAGTAADSQAIIDHLQATGWGSLRIDVSFAVLHADASVARRSYTTNGSYWEPDCDLAPVPVPAGGSIEKFPLDGYACDGGDCHLLVFQGTRLYELLGADIPDGQADGAGFNGGCLAIWDLTRDHWKEGSTPYARGDQCTSADAAGFPVAPLLLTAADLASGEIKHALRFTLPNSLIRARSYVHPATHGTDPAAGGASGGANTMPYGSRLRLAPGSYPGDAQAQIVIKALQTYGMFMADGGNLFISGTADLIGEIGSNAMAGLSPSDFEVVDQGPAIVWNGSCARTAITN